MSTLIIFGYPAPVKDEPETEEFMHDDELVELFAGTLSQLNALSIRGEA